MKIGDIVMIKPNVRGFDRYKNYIGFVTELVDAGWRDSPTIWKVRYQNIQDHTFLDQAQGVILN